VDGFGYAWIAGAVPPALASEPGEPAGAAGSVVATQTFENPERFPASSNVRSTKE